MSVYELISLGLTRHGGRPNTQEHRTLPPLLESHMARDSQLFANPQRLGDESSQKTPLAYLEQKRKVLDAELGHNLHVHKATVASGAGNVSRLRSMIEQNYLNISETYVALGELYETKVGKLASTLTSLDQWDNQRQRLLDDISRVKSPDLEDGAKLATLLDHSNEIDSDILEVQKKLESLIKKKEVVLKEITNTYSVLESRTLKQVEQFKHLEQEGRDLIHEHFPVGDEQEGVPTVAVDVTFILAYAKSREKSGGQVRSQLKEPELFHASLASLDDKGFINLQNLQSDDDDDYDEDDLLIPLSGGSGGGGSGNGSGLTLNEVDKSGVTVHEDNSKIIAKESIIGMKPYDPFAGSSPLQPSPRSLPEDSPAIIALEDMNHDHGATPFEQGYFVGAQKASLLRVKLSEFFGHLLRPTHPEATVKVIKTQHEDFANTISSKLDYVTIRARVEAQKAAYQKAISSSLAAAIKFHRYSTLWASVCKMIKDLETQLSVQISELQLLGAESGDKRFATTLRGTLSRLKLRIDAEEMVDPIITVPVYDEVKAIARGLALVEGTTMEAIYQEYKLESD